MSAAFISRIRPMLIALAIILVTPILATRAARASGPVDLTTGIHNGSPGAPGTIDDNWLVASTPTPAPNRNFSINPHPAWVTPPPGSSWVNPYGAGDGNYTSAPTGDYQYYLRFCLRPGTERDAQLNAQYSSDNGIAFSLNGVPIGGNPSQFAFQSLHPLTYAGPAFLPGMNVLVADVVNLHVVHGFLVSGSIEGVDSCAVPPAPVATCHAVGVLIDEQEASGAVGDTRVEHAVSTAETAAVPANAPLERGDPATPPSSPAAHDDAAVQSVSYSNASAGVAISARTVHSRCDVAAVETGQDMQWAQSYGRAGVEDLTITTTSGAIKVRALDLALKAIGEPQALTLEEACTTGLVEVLWMGGVNECQFQQQALGAVSIGINERWGPHSGAALHVKINAPVIVDVYIGLVEVGVLSTRDW